MPAPEEFTQGDQPSYDVTVYTDRAESEVQSVAGATVVGRLGLKTVPSTSLSVDGTVEDGPGGVVRVTFPSADTAALAPGIYALQVQVTINGVPWTVLDREVRVIPRLPAVS